MADIGKEQAREDEEIEKIVTCEQVLRDAIAKINAEIEVGV